MIVVTGAAGFIGSNCMIGLNRLGINDILAVDDLSDGKKYQNLSRARICDYMDYQDFLQKIDDDEEFENPIRAVIHQGACSTTTEWDGRYMMDINYEYSKVLYHYCVSHSIPFIYASSAAVYGCNEQCDEQSVQETPLNVYGYSKWLFDQYVMQQPKVESQVAGLRYFNVYGPGESHKGGMASVAYHFTHQLMENGCVKLFGAGEGCEAGEHRRDFIYIDDVVSVVLWLHKNPEVSGLFNLGSGQARSFNDLAKILIANHGSGEIDYLPFPDSLKGCYQSFTQANIGALRQAGFDAPMTTLEVGLEAYFNYLS